MLARVDIHIRPKHVYRLILVAVALAALLAIALYRRNSRAHDVADALRINGFTVIEDTSHWVAVPRILNWPVTVLRIRSSKRALLTNELMTALSNCPDCFQSFELDLSSISSISGKSDKAMRLVSELKQLDSLALYHMRASESQTLNLCNLQRLESLHINGRGFGDREAECLASLRNLKLLNLTETTISNASIKHLTRLPLLRDVRLGFTEIDDRCFDECALSEGDLLFATVRLLELTNTGVSDVTIGQFYRCPHLEIVNLTGTKISDIGVALMLSRCTSLKTITLDECSVNGKAWCQEPWASLVEVVNVQNTRLSGADIVRMIRSHISIKQVLFSGCDVSPWIKRRLSDYSQNEVEEMVLQVAATSKGDRTATTIGDAMLDRYIYGDVCRISPEAPVMIVNANNTEDRPGGAGAAASFLRHLGVRVSLLSAVGDDQNGSVLSQLLTEQGIDTNGVFRDADRVTTVKERIVGVHASESRVGF